MVPIRRKDFLVPLTRNPLEMYLLLLCVLSGTLGLLGVGARSPSHLPAWADVAWYVLLLFGGLLGVLGICWRDALTGLLIERAAMWPIAAGSAMYAAALAHAGQWASAPFLVGFSVAAATRAIQVAYLVRTRLRR